MNDPTATHIGMGPRRDRRDRACGADDCGRGGHEQSAGGRVRVYTGVCTKNSFRVDDVMESPKLAE